MSLEWASFAVRLDGPGHKTSYGGDERALREGLVYHSMEGSLSVALRMLANPALQKSWTFSNPKHGQLIQHYAVGKHTWANGSRESNEKFVSCENEGVAGEPLTQSQIDNLVELTVWAYTTQEWTTLTRRISMWEHKELQRFGSPATACPSDRIPWSIIIARAEKIINEPPQEDDDMKPFLAWDRDRKRIYLVGPWGATWITTAKDVKKFEELYGKLDVRFGKATMDALDQKRTVPAL